MVITKIQVKETGEETLKEYINRELDMTDCEIRIGKCLKIRYTTGGWFSYEEVTDVTYPDKTSIIVETLSKIWAFGVAVK